MDVANLKSALLKADGATPFNVHSDFEALVHIIEMTGHERTVNRIIDLTEAGETPDGDIMESGEDVADFFIKIKQTIEDIEDRKHFKTPRTFSQDELDTILLFSCLCGFTFLVRELVLLGADLQTKDKDGNTPLLVSAKNTFINIARILIERKVNVNTANDDGDTALTLATGSDNSVEMVKLLLAHTGINVNHENKDGNTALMKAVEDRNYAGNSVEVVKLFLAQTGIDVNHQNKGGNTALMKAIENWDSETQSLEVLKLLLAQAGIDVNHQNKDGYTALMKAVADNNYVVIELLLDSQVNTTEGLDGIRNCRSETALDIADKMGMTTVVSLLKQHIAKVNNPLLAAVLTCDMDSFNIVMDSHDYEPSHKQQIIQDSFNAIFEKHGKSKENFSENEEMITQRLLQCGADFDDLFNSSKPLKVATMVGSCSVLTMLLNHQTHLHMLSNWELECLLETSIEHDHAHIIEVLLKHSQNLAAKTFTVWALISAMKHGHIDCIEMLKKFGATLDIKCAFKSAVENDNPERLKYLVENFKAEINDTFSTDVMNDFVVAASSEGHINIIGMLLDAGADVNCVSKRKKTPLMEAKNAQVINFLVKKGAIVNMTSTKNGQVDSPLTYVLSKCYYRSDFKGKVNVVKALLKHGADVNEDPGSGSPLTIAVSNRARKVIVQLLLDRGADINAWDSEGNTVLLTAVGYEASRNVVQLLLDRGAEVSVRNKVGDSVLHIATKIDYTENIECLLQHSGVRHMINVRNRRGFTALMIAVRRHNNSAVKILINHGADVNVKNKDGNTALMIAVSSKIQFHEIVRTLIQAGSDVNWQNVRGHSALMLTATRAFVHDMALLLDSGADINAVSRNNETVLTLSLNGYGEDSYDAGYLLDNGAWASYVRPDSVLKLILQKELPIISQLIRCGLGPAGISASDDTLCKHPASITTVSPLYMALMTGNVKLASYFVETLFVTKSDMFTLIYNKDVRKHLRCLRRHKCLHFLNKLSSQPLSLFSLAYLEVQSAITPAPGREERISLLPLPQIIKDKLLRNEYLEDLDLLDKTLPTSVCLCTFCMSTSLYP